MERAEIRRNLTEFCEYGNVGSPPSECPPACRACLVPGAYAGTVPASRRALSQPIGSSAPCVAEPSSLDVSREPFASFWDAGSIIARAGREKEHRLKSDFKAASVIERLSTSLTDAEIHYQAGQGIHEFIVRLGGMRHVVDFSDDLMEKKNEMDLSVVILGIVERASTQSMPVHFMVRNDNFDKLMQALKH
ncbi:MAG TPA: hypothetical protein VGR01_18490 [Burkholderiales bacterium]|jgi:hypothetical protein|nr:hypothetical protein [Burkholderiales bacterium]